MAFGLKSSLSSGCLDSTGPLGSAAEVKAKQAWLASWGYGSTPFFAEVGGLLTWPVKEGRFMVSAQRRTTGVLVPVEAIYAAWPRSG